MNWFNAPGQQSQPFGPANDGSWYSSLSSIARVLGFSFFASLLQSDSLASSSAKLFLLGSLLETGRRFFRWVYERFDFFQYSITAQFDEGDPVYEWITLFLTEKQIWKRSRRFRVTARSSRRKWGINLGRNKSQNQSNTQAEYVPTYDAAQLFRWNGYWAETRRGLGSRGPILYTPTGEQGSGSKQLYLTIYTRDMSALSSFVDDARDMYLTFSQPHVTVHTVEQNGPYPHPMGMANPWMNTKIKSRRPLSSIILQQGVIQSLIEDAKEFLSMVDWYATAGIPHRRGYLLHGPPGTGKTSTIYAIAGELGLEIYSLSLASGFVDDSFLQRAVSSIPYTAILLIEDIDCAFQSRDDMEEDSIMPSFPGAMLGRPPNFSKSGVTLSGLLNVLDGVGSEEGKLFFATTNYVDRLDPALLRPGRIDRKVQYHLSTKSQAEALFLRFYPPSYTTLSESSQPTNGFLSDPQNDEKPSTEISVADKEARIKSLASQFASGLPENEFSIAELQGYLLSCKKEPERAVVEFQVWADDERKEKEARKVREEERKSRAREKKDAKEAERLQGPLEKLGLWGISGNTTPAVSGDNIRIDESRVSGSPGQGTTADVLYGDSESPTTTCTGCACSKSIHTNIPVQATLNSSTAGHTSISNTTSTGSAGAL